MTQEEFLKCLRTTANIIKDSEPYKKNIGLGNFLIYFDKYKNDIFSDFAQEVRDSSSFLCLVNEVMGIVSYLDSYRDTKIVDLPNNVVNLNSYRKKTTLRAVS